MTLSGVGGFADQARCGLPEKTTPQSHHPGTESGRQTKHNEDMAILPRTHVWGFFRSSSAERCSLSCKSAGRVRSPHIPAGVFVVRRADACSICGERFSKDRRPYEIDKSKHSSGSLAVRQLWRARNSVAEREHRCLTVTWERVREEQGRTCSTARGRQVTLEQAETSVDKVGGWTKILVLQASVLNKRTSIT